MDRGSLLAQLTKLRDVILEERLAAKALQVDKMLELTDEKDCLLKQMLPMVQSIGELTAAEKAMAETVNSENLRNAYFFLSALRWVRQSMGFIGDKLYPESYEGNGSMVKGRYSGALLSGRV